MKTTFSQIVAIAFFGLFLLVGNVNAEGTEKSASSHENIEAALTLENWMVNDNFWATKEIVQFENTNEESLVLENWMTAESTWEVSNTNQVETEKNLEVEPWMTNENIWK